MKYSDLNLTFDATLAVKAWHPSLRLVPCKEVATIFFGTSRSSIGPMMVFWADDGLRYIGLNAERAMERAVAIWPSVPMARDDKKAAHWVKDIETVWSGKKLPSPMNMAVAGTPFQMAVWQALMKIPTGHVVNYGTVAAAIGAPRAVRAVGSAVGRNPITLLVPCHRVIQKNGSVINYGWGDAMKQRILKMEAAA